MRNIIIVLVTSLILASPSWAQAQEALKLAYVDLQKALNLCVAGKDAKDAFGEVVKNAEKRLSLQQDELTELKDLLEKQGMMLNEEVRRNKAKEYEVKLRDFKRLYDDSQQDLQEKDAELTKDILGDLVGVVDRYGKENNYTFVFEKNETLLLYGSSALDITDEIIKIYDTEYQASKSP
jgi:outer membrane protein